MTDHDPPATDYETSGYQHVTHPLRVRVKVLDHGHAIDLPAYQSLWAAGMDILAAIEKPWPIAPHEVVLIPSGFAIALPPGYEAQIRPRSGLATKHRITLPNSPGTIDADYRGEIKVALTNFGNETFEITPKMRIAQMIVAPVMHVQWETVDDLDATERGSGGFGHTGLA